MFKPLQRINKIQEQGYQLGGGGAGDNGNANCAITAIAASSRGVHLAWGDASGRVFFLERENTVANDDDDDDAETGGEGEDDEENHHHLHLDEEDSFTFSRSNNNNKRQSSTTRGKNAIRKSKSVSRKVAAKFRMPSGQPFTPVHGATCYSSYVDPLSSQDVRPAVTALAFLPETSPSALLLTANEKTPKLWRLVKVPSLATPIRSVNMLGSRQVGPLTHPDRLTSVLKEVRKFNVDHEYNIHSLCVIRDGTQFISADDFTIRLWNVEYEHRGLLVSNENGNQSNSSSSGGDGEGEQTANSSEVINVVHAAPHAPHTLLVGLSGGQVRISDLRCNLKITNSNSSSSMKMNNTDGGGGVSGSDGNSLMLSAHPPNRACDGLYRAVSSATIGCDLSLCGNYVAQRDVSCLHLFDIRKASSSFSSSSSSSSSLLSPPPCLVNRWVLQDHVAKNFRQLYQLGSLFEKVSVRFVGSRIVTGGFGECIITVNALDSTAENVEVRRILCETEPATIEMEMGDFGEANQTTDDEDVARLYRAARLRKGNDRDITTRYSYLSSSNSNNDSPVVSSSSNNWSGIALTAEESYNQHLLHHQHHHLQHDGGGGGGGGQGSVARAASEWRRVTKLCVLPSPSWVGIGNDDRINNNNNNKNGVFYGELLATCGDTVHHISMEI